MPLYNVRVGYSEMVFYEGYVVIEAPDERTAIAVARRYQDEVPTFIVDRNGGEFDDPQVVGPDYSYDPTDERLC